jgi:hypothetical protein
MFLILADFLSTLGGEGGMDGEGSDLFTAGRAGTARKEEWVCRGVLQGGPVQQAVPEHTPRQAGTTGKKSGSAGGFSRADQYSRQFLSTRPGRRYGKESRAGQDRRAQGQVGMGGGEGGLHLLLVKMFIRFYIRHYKIFTWTKGF